MSLGRTASQPPATSGSVLERHPSLPYVLPFAAFLLLLAVSRYTAPLGRWDFPLRVGVVAAVLLLFSRHVISFRLVSPIGSIVGGVLLFLAWIAPDVLIPGYRHHWLFQNTLTGTLASSIERELQGDSFVLFFRAMRAVFIVPIVEELFWRAWLMRWLVNQHFDRVPLGAWTWSSVCLTAVLFASEHGPYWDVGLVAGVFFNWWMIRTRSLGDCILAHAVTNACLSLYVVLAGKWEYWL